MDVESKEYKDMIDSQSADTTSDEAEMGSSADESLVANSDVDEGEISGNMAWASAMSKVLSTASKQPNIILSKAKKDSEVKPKVDEGPEIVDESGKPIAVKKVKEKKKSYSEKRKEMIEKHKKKAEWEAMCRVKPDILKKEKEKELIKIATRGVVHLFNTVEKHQKVHGNPKKDSKKDKRPNVVKGNFMDILKEYSKKDKVEDCPVVKKAKEEETWSILKEDFMMGAEMKDWDKESDTET